jgi:hypothetical protein
MKKIILTENQYEKLKHDASYYDESNTRIPKEIEFNKLGVDDELTIYFKDNVDKDTITEFLKEFNSARKKIENRFKLKLGRQYKDPDAQYNIFFGKNIVFDDTYNGYSSAEYIRGYAQHSPTDSFYFNLPKVKELYDMAKKDWIPNPNYKANKSRSYNINKIEDIIIHEIAHALYFQQPTSKRKQWEEYFNQEGWQNATSFYGQENDQEMFAETIVDLINGESNQAVSDLVEIFNF